MAPYFVSYASRDHERMAALVDALRDQQLDLWVDVNGLRAGDAWLEGLEKQLDACSGVLVLMSSSARQSDWVKREILYALERRKPIFIARYDEVPLPLSLIDRQFTPFETDFERGVARLTAAIRAHDAQPETDPAAVLRASEDNFFAYLAQMPNGGPAMALVARHLYHWAQQQPTVPVFSGEYNPTLHVQAGAATLFSIVAYLRNPMLVFPLVTWPTNAHSRPQWLTRLATALPDLVLDTDKTSPSLRLRDLLAGADTLEAIEQGLATLMTALKPPDS